MLSGLRLSHVSSGFVAIAVAALLLTSLPLRAQDVGVTTSNLNLRRGPSKQSRRITTVARGDTLQLLPTPARNNYYRVVSSQDDTGWVWAARVERLSVSGAPSPAAAENAAAAPTGNPNWAAWQRPPPQELQGGTCQAVGRGTTRVDSATNLLKNRVDIPNSYHEVTVADVLALPDQGLPTRRWKWSGSDSAMVLEYEDVPIAIDGYLVDAVEEGKEATNCGIDTHPWHDWHIWLVATQGESVNHQKNQAVVVEVTPRVRALPMNWSLSDLRTIRSNHERVRISGWLMFDPDHPNNIGTSRGTIWEIHPVTKIEVFRNGNWVDLNQ